MLDVNKNFDPNTQIALIWSIADVQTDEVRPDLTDEEAFDVLLSVERHHDANYGVGWDTLKATADEMFSSQFDHVWSLNAIQELLGQPCKFKSSDKIVFFSYGNADYLLSCYPDIVEIDGVICVSSTLRYDVLKHIPDEADIAGKWIVLHDDISNTMALNNINIDIAGATCYKDFMQTVRKLFDEIILDNSDTE